ncbi:hypothetical protein TNCV_1271011 [Trichonephila clavipes]|nr:hypothetical protein TNCV_1271011 [Trichonephila clavipes]
MDSQLTETPVTTLDATSQTRTNSMHQDGYIHVWWLRVKRTIDRVHSSLLYCSITWRDGMGCYWIHVSLTSCSHSLHPEQCTVNFWSVPVALFFIRALRNPTIQHDNARLHAAGNERTFLDEENVRHLPRPTCSPDLSPKENAWSMVTIRLSPYSNPYG